MTKILALDIGMKRTGVAFGDDEKKFVIALDTLKHTSTKQLVSFVKRITLDRKVEKLAIGLPRLPDGMEGEQAMYVKKIAERLKIETNLPLVFIDERYTSHPSGVKPSDPDAQSACSLLNTVLELNKAN